MSYNGSQDGRRSFLKKASALGAVGVSASVAGCFGDDGNGGNGNGQAAVEDPDELPEENITLSHTSDPDPQNHPEHQARTIKNYMESRTDGQFTVDIAAGGELGTTTDIIEQTIDGTIEVVSSIAEGHIAPFYPNINVYSVPYVFPDVEVANRVFDKEFGDTLREDMLDKTGLRMLAWWDNGGFRHFSANTELRSVDDFDGLTIRTMQIEAHQEIVRQLGASPEAIDWTELYDALNQGVVDGQENAIPTFTLPNLQEVQDYVIMDGHVFTMVFNCVNDEWFQGLHPTYQQLFREANFWAMNDARAVTRILRESDLEMIQEEYGVEVYEPTPDEIDEFQDATQEPVEELIRDEMDDPELLGEMYDAIEAEMEPLPGYDEFEIDL